MKETTNASANAASPLDQWVFGPESKLIPDEQYIELEVVDLREFHELDEPSFLQDTAKAASQADIIQRTLSALRTTGFLAVKGHGLSGEQIQHQFSLGKLLNGAPTEEEKRELHASIKEGSWAGYKVEGYYKRPDGAYDTTENYDLYPFTAVESRLPSVAKPYLADIRGFIEHNHYFILRKILGIISLGLGLEADALWRLHHRGGNYDNDGSLRGGSDEKISWKHSKDHLRYIMYHPPREEDRDKKKHLWLPGHTDLGSVSFLYSQPIAGLQVLTAQGEWKYVRHYPDHIIVDLGDSMEFVTGGILKAAPHRVKEPPEDQRHLDRLGIFYFVPFLPDVYLSPLDHPSIRALGGKDIFEEYYELGGKPMNSEEWLVERSKLIGSKRDFSQKSGVRKALEDITYRYNPA